MVVPLLPAIQAAGRGENTRHDVIRSRQGFERERSYRSVEAWFVRAGGQRSKEYARNLYPVTPENDALLLQWKGLAAQKREVESKMNDVVVKMTTVLAISGETEE